MKEQMSVTELIQTVSQSMKGDGLKQDYITQLSYTWKALEQYLAEYDLIFSRDTAFSFLKDKYGIHADQNFSRLRPIGKRRKRAICALLYCADGLLLGSSYSQMVVPSVYRTDEIEKMLVSFNQSSAVGIRNYAMVLMAARLGMRASNICALEFKNIHWERNTIEFITVKTGKPAVLPLPADVGNAIIRYIKNVRPSSADNHIFLRMQASFKKLNPASLHMIVTNAFRDAGIIAKSGRRHPMHCEQAWRPPCWKKRFHCQSYQKCFLIQTQIQLKYI